MAGRVLVANQVILATAWYTASCWMLDRSSIKKLRRLVHNFLWTGSNGTKDMRARISWSTCILPCSEGGLGIIDLDIQSRALLSKLIICGIFPRNEPRKDFLRQALTQCIPPLRGDWQPSYRFICMQIGVRMSSSSFMSSRMRVWLSMRRGFIQRRPELIEEFERQPLIWN